MQNIKLPIYFTTFLFVIYIATSRFEPLWKITFMLFIILHVALVIMVIKVLKKGVPSKYTFDERFYEDKDQNELGIF